MKFPSFTWRRQVSVTDASRPQNPVVSVEAPEAVTRQASGSRSASVVIAVTIQRLLDDPMRSWNKEEELVLEALRRSTNALRDASGSEIAEYLTKLEPQQLRGVVNNVKGIYHELLFVHAENTDGDEVMARVFGATNHPGADVEFLVDGNVIRQVQLKAVASHASISKHLEKYPDIKVLVTDEIALGRPGMGASGFNNVDLREDVSDRLDDLAGESFAKEVLDSAATSAFVSTAITAGLAVREGRFSREHLQGALGDVAVGVVAGTVLDMLIDGGA